MRLSEPEAAETRRNARELACTTFKIFAAMVAILIALSLIDDAMGGMAALGNVGLGLICAAGNVVCGGE
jgi:hypothetical protein